MRIIEANPGSLASPPSLNFVKSLGSEPEHSLSVSNQAKGRNTWLALGGEACKLLIGILFMDVDRPCLPAFTLACVWVIEPKASISISPLSCAPIC